MDCLRRKFFIKNVCLAGLQHNVVLHKVFKALSVLTPPYIPDCPSFSVPSRIPLGPLQLSFWMSPKIPQRKWKMVLLHCLSWGYAMSFLFIWENCLSGQHTITTNNTNNNANTNTTNTIHLCSNCNVTTTHFNRLLAY